MTRKTPCHSPPQPVKKLLSLPTPYQGSRNRLAKVINPSEYYMTGFPKSSVYYVSFIDFTEKNSFQALLILYLLYIK